MSNKEIKISIDQLYKVIKDSQEEIKTLREKCKHEETFEGNYSWRIGSIVNATICSFCGEVIKTPFSDYIIENNKLL